VDAVKLLNIVRRELLSKAEARSGNALVDEQYASFVAFAIDNLTFLVP
jgi:hypothetical protein